MLKNLLKNKNSLLVVLLLLLTLPAVISLSKTSQDVRKRAQTSNNNQQNSDLWQTTKGPEFKEGEVIVKLKEPISSQAIKQTDQVKKANFDTQAITIEQLETQQLPKPLQDLINNWQFTREKAIRRSLSCFSSLTSQ